MPNITALGDITGRSVSSCEWVRNDARRLSTEALRPVTLLTHLRAGSLHRLRGSGSGRSGAHA